MRHRSRSILWALLLIGIGVVLLLQNAGAIPDNVQLWPLILIAIGLWLLFERIAYGGRWGGGFVAPLVLIAIGTAFLLEDLDLSAGGDVVLPLIAIAVGLGLVADAIAGRERGAPPGPASESVPLEGAPRGKVTINHGAGRLSVRSHLGGSNLLEGSFAGGVDLRVHRDAGRVDAVLSSSTRNWRWAGGAPFDWSVTLTRQVPLTLELRTGANSADLDLSDLQIEDLTVETGASRTAITLPSSGRTRARIRGGATDIRVTVPGRVAAQIEITGGLSSMKVDETRFPKAGGVYRSPDFDQAENRAEIRVDAGAANVEVS